MRFEKRHKKAQLFGCTHADSPGCRQNPQNNLCGSVRGLVALDLVPGVIDFSGMSSQPAAMKHGRSGFFVSDGAPTSVNRRSFLSFPPVENGTRWNAALSRIKRMPFLT